MDFLATQAPALFAGIQNLLHISFSISPILVLSAHSWQRYHVNSVYLSRVCCIQRLSTFLLTIIQVFRSLGNQRPRSLIVIEDCILSAAMKLSHGEHFGTTMSSLYEALKASQDALTGDPESSKWFDLSIPTNLLNHPPPESARASLLPNALSHLVADKNRGGLVTPPFSPQGFPSTSALLRSPCMNPQQLGLHHLSLDEDVPMAKETDLQTETQRQPEQDGDSEANKEWRAESDNSDGGDGDGGREVHEEDSHRDGGRRGKEEDEDSMAVEEPQEDEVEGVEDVPEEDGREPQHEAQEEGEDDEVPGDKVNDGGTCWSNMHPVTGFIPSYVGTTVDRYLDLLDSNLSSLEDSDEEQEGEQEGEQEEGGQEEDMKQQDTGEEDGEEEAGGEEAGKEEAGEEEDALEKDVVQKDVVRKDVVEEDLQILSLRRSARLQRQGASPASSDQHLAIIQKRPGRNTSTSKPSRTRADLLELVSVRIAT